jgi:VanZ family protein
MANRKISIYLILSVFYMGVIFYLSSSSMKVSALLSAWDKFAHAAVYAILTALVYMVLRELNVGKTYVLVLAFAISFLYGIFNEIHQYFLPWRQADILDVLANGLGAFCIPLSLYLQGRNRKR